MLTSPYNFVPLNSKVYLPDWSDNVSQDIPFEDGEDGYIEVTWHNYSPLFIRNEDKNNPDPIHIDVNGNRRYFIPGSSIKGMLRNTLSILAFGKMAEGEQYKDRRFSFRLDKDSAKIDYKYSVRNLIEAEQNPRTYQKKYDLCETIFGRIGNDSLKGRVQFSHAWTESEITPNNPVNGVLGQPKAKYYPFYLQQDKDSLTYATYSTEGARISGRKRYRIHRSKNVKMLPQGNNNNNTTTSIKAIPEGYDFAMRINLHNMRPAEIGAILSAITFHLNKDVYHNIGCAKSFGYGKIKATNIKLSEQLKYKDIRPYLALFEKTMNDFCGKDWTAIPQIKKILGIMSEHDDDQVHMMSLNEYTEGKKNTNKPKDIILKEERDEDSISFTQINGIKNRIASIKQILSDDIESNTTPDKLNSIQRQYEKSLELCKNLDNEVEGLLCVIDFTSIDNNELINIREQISKLKKALNEQIKKVDALNQAILHDDFVRRNIELYQQAERYADCDNNIAYGDLTSLNNKKRDLETSVTTYETIVSKMTAEGLDHTEEDNKINALKSTIVKIEKSIAELNNNVPLRDILEETMPNRQYKVKEWRVCKQRIDKYLRDHTLTELTDDDRIALCDTVRRLSQNPSRDERRSNAWTRRDSNVWKGVESYLGKEATDSLFDEINTK